MNIRTVMAVAAVSSMLSSAPLWADAIPGPEGAPQKEDALAALTKENAQLQEKVKFLESNSVTTNALAARSCKKLKDVAADIRVQRQGMADFEGYVKWMSNNMAGYTKYLAAGSVAAGFAKVLPIPYAGQASMFTKFVSNAAISLSAASVSINKYLITSQQFLTRADALDPAKEVDPAEICDLIHFADQELLKGMVEVQESLASTTELTTSSLAFLVSLNHYVGSTDAYWNKTKSLLKSGDDKKEKSFLAENISNLKNKASAFGGRFKTFEETVKKDTPLIKSLVAYNDLMRELTPKVAKAK